MGLGYCAQTLTIFNDAAIGIVNWHPMYIGSGGKSGSIGGESGISFGTVFVIKHLGFVFLDHKEARRCFLGMGRFVSATRHGVHASDKPFLTDLLHGADILVLHIDNIDNVELYGIANDAKISFGYGIFSFE